MLFVYKTTTIEIYCSCTTDMEYIYTFHHINFNHFKKTSKVLFFEFNSELKIDCIKNLYKTTFSQKDSLEVSDADLLKYHIETNTYVSGLSLRVFPFDSSGFFLGGGGGAIAINQKVDQSIYCYSSFFNILTI